MANLVAEQLAFRLFKKFVLQISIGNMVDSMQALTAIASILLILTPYIYGFHSQAPARKWLRKIFQELTGEIPSALQNRKRAWFTDTLEDVNGVATTIRKMAAAGAAAGKELIVVTSRSELNIDNIPIKNFRPIGEFELPEYELQKLSFPRILHTELFNPARRDPAFWEKYGAATNGEVRLLYVGRISREKDLDVLANAYRRLREEGLSVQLFVVGHGPYSQALSETLPDAVFTGYLTGLELATAYASADVFAFPSTTDTFGNVIIEAQASGVPVVVSDSGGPKELVDDKTNGLVTKSHDVEDFTRAIRALIVDPALRERMGDCARQSVIDLSWPNAFRKFWSMTEV